MAKDKKAFGDYLRKAIKQAGISQSTFYAAVEITSRTFMTSCPARSIRLPRRCSTKCLNI